VPTCSNWWAPSSRRLQASARWDGWTLTNKLLLLTDDERSRGVIAMSAGNHAQGAAYHSNRMGIQAVIVMPRFTPA
jgi:threonine dehydratase